MPRVRPTKASPRFIVHGHTLSHSEKSRVLELLGYRHVLPARDDTQVPLGEKNPSVAIRDIEQALGIFTEAREHLDEIPRPAHYVAAFKPLRKSSYSFLETLIGLNDYFREKLESDGVDLDQLELMLCHVVDASRRVLKEYEGKSSKGAPAHEALTEVIRMLRIVFRDYYRGPVQGRRKRGAFTLVGPEERQEKLFITYALRAARIISQSDQRVAKLMRDPRCALDKDAFGGALRKRA